MHIVFNSELPEFELVNRNSYINWISFVVKNERLEVKEIYFIFVDENKILSINKEYLNHNYLTDIITFHNSFLNFISGEIYICIPVVKENATVHANSLFYEELKRVIIHGVLHLLGYKDSTEEEKILMREKENFYMKVFRERD